jgi:hypothetical protein
VQVALTKRDVIISIVSCVLGLIAGAAYVSSTKVAQLSDDIHDVKQDYDESKHRVAKDYRHTADKTKEILDNVDTADIGSSTTTGVKNLGKDAADGMRGLGGLLKNRLEEKLSPPCVTCGLKREKTNDR